MQKLYIFTIGILISLNTFSQNQQLVDSLRKAMNTANSDTAKIEAIKDYANIIWENYPDSGKVNIRRTREIFKQDDKVPYITGEEDPSKYWKK